MELSKQEIVEELRAALDIVASLKFEEDKMDCEDHNYNLDRVKQALIRAAKALQE